MAKTTSSVTGKLLSVIMLLFLAAGGLLFIQSGPAEKVIQKVGQKAPQVLDEIGRRIKFGLNPGKEVTMQPNSGALTLETPVLSSINGPLKVSKENPRYFAGADGQVIYLTGSHTWASLQDNGQGFPPPAFDYDAYLSFLQTNGHNFFRLWTWEQTRWTTETTDENYWFDPMPYQRTGPGSALDGKLKFDLTQFNQAYFDRMRARVIKAGERGIYVSVMLFNGWSNESPKGWYDQNNPWKGHPFNSSNNKNGIDGDLNNNGSGEETHTLANPAVTEIQKAYIRKVIDTVNDLDNVLYEVSNESDGGATEWQYEMVRFIKDYEASKPKQHPVGMTGQYPGGDNSQLYNSPADWISPNGDVNNPPPADGRKVILLDTDHLCGVCGDYQYVWKSFTQGYNPIFMDVYDGKGYGVGSDGFSGDDPTWVAARKNMGYTKAYARRMSMEAMKPRTDLSSTGYCLAGKSSFRSEYLIYAPDGGSFSVDLSGVTGDLFGEWFNPSTGKITQSIKIQGGDNYTFQTPFAGDAVLYLSSVNFNEHSYLPLMFKENSPNLSDGFFRPVHLAR